LFFNEYIDRTSDLNLAFYLFRRMDIRLQLLEKIPNLSNYIIDIGASSGQETDPVYLLYKNYKFGGLCIEANDSIHELEKKLPQDSIKKVQAYATPETIVSIFVNNKVPLYPDILKIDIDGYDLSVIREILSANYKPKIIIAEINEKIPPPIWFEIKYSKDYVWDGSHCFGFSLEAGSKTLQEYGYTAISLFEGNNAVFLDSKYIDLLGIPIKPLEEIYLQGYYPYLLSRCFPWNDDVNHWLTMTNEPDKLRESIFHYFTQANVRGKNIDPRVFILK
jgi:hypothetical protein